MTRSSTVPSDPMEAATIRKLRIRLLPFLFVLFVIAFIDRINLGFAALTMNRELAISSQQFGFAAGVFFWGYFLLEIPSNLILHKIGARVWIARILITWGAIATLTGFVQSVQQLYLARFALGLAEAGYFPGIVLYLGYWFPQKEKARAIASILIGIPFGQRVGWSHLRSDSGSRTLARTQQLEMATHSGRFAGGNVRISRAHPVAESTGGGQFPYHRREGGDRPPNGAGGQAKTGWRETIHFCAADSS